MVASSCSIDCMMFGSILSLKSRKFFRCRRIFPNFGKEIHSKQTETDYFYFSECRRRSLYHDRNKEVLSNSSKTVTPFTTDISITTGY